MAPPIGVLGCLWRTRELAFLQNNQSGVRAVRNRLGMEAYFRGIAILYLGSDSEDSELDCLQ